MAYTNRGAKWELLNSLWIIVAFVPAMGYAGFFWIGGRTGTRKWIIAGLIYLVLLLGLPISAVAYRNIELAYGTVAAVWAISWFSCIVHSFLSRREYLIRQESVTDLKAATRDAYRDEIRNEYMPQPVNPQLGVGWAGSAKPQAAWSQTTYLQDSPQATTMPTWQPPALTDLNTADEQQLAALPGVGVALAKRAVLLRAQAGGFHDVPDFCARLGLSSHFVQQVANLAYASPQPPIPILTETTTPPPTAAATTPPTPPPPTAPTTYGTSQGGTSQGATGRVLDI